MLVHAGVTAIYGIGYGSMVLKTDGSLWATGKNQDGQLGDGTNIDKNNFVLVIESG